MLPESFLCRKTFFLLASTDCFRKLDVLFEAEEKIMNRLLSDASVMELMRQSSVHEDSLRIMLINYLCSSNTSQVAI